MKIKQILTVGLITLSILGTMEMACRFFGASQRTNGGFQFYVRQVDNDLRLDYIIENPLLMWSLKPAYKDDLIHINSHGFRDVEYDPKKPFQAFRILCLGDSSTFGMHVPIEKTYHSLLEKRLHHRRKNTGRHYQVINGGVVGYTSLQGLVLFRSKAAAFSPDLVTAYFGVNETVQRFCLSDLDIIKPDRPRWLRLFTNKWLLKSDLARTVQQIASKVLREKNIMEKRPIPRIPIKNYRDIILQLKTTCDQNGAKLVLISPALRNISYDKKSRAWSIIEYRKILETTATEAGIPLLTIPELTEYSAVDSSGWFLPGDPLHPSQAGHELIMQRLYDFIVENGLLP